MGDLFTNITSSFNGLFSFYVRLQGGIRPISLQNTFREGAFQGLGHSVPSSRQVVQLLKESPDLINVRTLDAAIGALQRSVP